MPGLSRIVMPPVIGFLLGKEALGGLPRRRARSWAPSSRSSWPTPAARGTTPRSTSRRATCGGKGSDAHKAAVVGDTVGDPFKDTSGPG